MEDKQKKIIKSKVVRMKNVTKISPDFMNHT